MPKKLYKKFTIYIGIPLLLFFFFIFARFQLFTPTTESIYHPIDTLINQVLISEKTYMPSVTDNQNPNQIPDKNQLLGKITIGHESLVLIEAAYANRSGMYMNKEAYRAFLDMYKAAEADGIKLIIVSAFRDFNHQKRIWENKWNGRQMLAGGINAQNITSDTDRSAEILKYSSMPGTSRHHWGTDIDLNSLNNSYFAKGEGKRIYEWLVKNAHQFGFCQPYTPKDITRIVGYEEEKWHWSYMPLSRSYLEKYMHIVCYDDISGFDGWETAIKLDVIRNYVYSINVDCR